MKYSQRWKPGTPCPNNSEVICWDHSRCDRCGWNPSVAEKRNEEVIAELKKKRKSQKGIEV